MMIGSSDFNKRFPHCNESFSTVPIIIDTDMQAVDCLWNQDGSILAVCGIRPGAGIERESNVVIFYTPMGEVGYCDWKGDPKFS